MTRCVSEARRALGDGRQQIIKTVPRRGYLVDVPISPGPLAPASIAAAIKTDAAGMDALQENDAGAKTGGTLDSNKEGERKQVTVLCASCRATLEAAAARDPEEALTIFEDVLGLITEAVDRYEGTINLTTADGWVVALMARYSVGERLKMARVTTCPEFKPK